MKLSQVKMRNFMPYKAPVSLGFAQDDTRNVTLIFGENTRGKTSILNAIRWAFYGKVVGRHGKEIPRHKLLNRDAAKEGDWDYSVSICFEASGVEYEIHRGASRKELIGEPNKAEHFDESVSMKKDGVPVRADLIAFEINRVAPEDISRFFLFDGELLQEYESLLIEGSEQGRKIKRAIEQVLGVPALTRGRDDIGALLKASQSQQAKDLRQVKGLERQAEHQADLQSKQQTIESSLKTLKDSLSDVSEERLALTEELDKYESSYKQKMDIDRKKDEIERYEAEQEEIRTEQEKCKEELWREIISDKIRLHRQYLQDSLSKLTDEIKNKSILEEKKRELSSILESSSCSVCKQSIGQQHKEAIAGDLAPIEAKLELASDRENELAAISSEIQALAGFSQSGIIDKIEELDKRFDEINVQVTRLENEINEIQDEIKEFDTAEIERKRKRRDYYLKEEGRLQRQVDECDKELDSIERKLQMLSKTIGGDPRGRASESTAIVELCARLEDVYKSSIAGLREKLRSSVESYATEAFLRMTTQPDYKALSINENYGLNIIDDLGEEVDVRSAGAEQVVALALIDGLGRASRAEGPIVMDTPFGRLDPTHRSNILQYLPESTSQLVLLVHEGEVNKEENLRSINDRVGLAYEIENLGARQSRLRRLMR